MTRRFAHVDGFKDATDHLRVDAAGTHIVRRDDTELTCSPHAYSLPECERLVARGEWKELNENDPR